MTIILDAKNMTSKDRAHAYIKEQLDMPDYYGNNLDALWDVLSTLKDANIIISNHHLLQENLGAYGQKLLAVFQELNTINTVNVIID